MGLTWIVFLIGILTGTPVAGFIVYLLHYGKTLLITTNHETGDLALKYKFIRTKNFKMVGPGGKYRPTFRGVSSWQKGDRRVFFVDEVKGEAYTIQKGGAVSWPDAYERASAMEDLRERKIATNSNPGKLDWALIGAILAALAVIVGFIAVFMITRLGQATEATGAV